MFFNKDEVVEILENLRVFESPIWNLNGSESEVIGGHKAIRMKRDNSLVRIVSPNYHIIQHIDAFNQTIDDLDKLQLKYDIRNLVINDYDRSNNKRHNSIQTTFGFPDLNFNVDGGQVNATLELFNSNDATLMFTRKFGAFRQTCRNSMCIGGELFYECFKHVGKKDPVSMAKAIEKLPDFLKIFGEVIEKTMTVRIDNVITRELIELGFPSRLIDNLEVASEKYQKLVDEAASSDVLWGVYQILTNWISNVVAKTNIERADRLGKNLYRFIRMKISGI
jgi:hypothetical protein